MTADVGHSDTGQGILEPYSKCKTWPGQDLVKRLTRVADTKQRDSCLVIPCHTAILHHVSAARQQAAFMLLPIQCAAKQVCKCKKAIVQGATAVCLSCH